MLEHEAEKGVAAGVVPYIDQNHYQDKSKLVSLCYALIGWIQPSFSHHGDMLDTKRCFLVVAQKRPQESFGTIDSLVQMLPDWGGFILDHIDLQGLKINRDLVQHLQTHTGASTIS